MTAIQKVQVFPIKTSESKDNQAMCYGSASADAQVEKRTHQVFSSLWPLGFKIPQSFFFPTQTRILGIAVIPRSNNSHQLYILGSMEISPQGSRESNGKASCGHRVHSSTVTTTVRCQQSRAFIRSCPACYTSTTVKMDTATGLLFCPTAFACDSYLTQKRRSMYTAKTSSMQYTK